MSPFIGSVTQVESGWAAAQWKIVNQYTGQVFRSYNWLKNLQEALKDMEEKSEKLFQIYEKTKKKLKSPPKVVMIDKDFTSYDCEYFYSPNRKVVKLERVVQIK